MACARLNSASSPKSSALPWGNCTDVYQDDLVNVWFSTSASQPTSLIGATLLGTADETLSNDGWDLFNFTIPGSVTSPNVWLIFETEGQGGNDMYMDDVSWSSNTVSSANYYCSITSGSCGTVTTNPVTIKVVSVPTADITGTTTICSGNSPNSHCKRRRNIFME